MVVARIVILMMKGDEGFSKVIKGYGGDDCEWMMIKKAGDEDAGVM